MGAVIGFTWPPYHDTAVSVIVDGKLVFASEEERYTRNKHAIAQWPINSMLAALKFLKDTYNIRPNDIDAFAINVDPKISTPMEKRYAASLIMNQVGGLRLGSYDAIPIEFYEYLKRRQSSSKYDFAVSARIYLEYVYSKMSLGLNKDIKIYPVVHHLSHAASSYYFSGFNSVASVIVDARGENSATTIWKIKNGEFDKVLDIHWRDGSLGSIYDGVSIILKFGLREGPGKVMGLAPYGKYNKIIDSKMKEIIRVTGGDKPYSMSKRLGGKSYYEEYKEMMLPILGDIDLSGWHPREQLNSNAADLAHMTQKFIEDAMMSIVRWAKDNTGENTLCLAGGVALNAKANMNIYYSHLFNNLFIFPASDDAGSSTGAAAYVYEHVVGEKMQNEPLKDVYLGPTYGEEEIKQTVKGAKWKAQYLGGDVEILSKMVAQDKVIAIYNGRAEFGPRALGDRSIVANPKSKNMWKLINQIKGREWWRPLASSLLIDDMGRYFEDPTYHRFMVLMLKAKKETKSKLPAICHVDSTSRVQMVKRGDNKIWYDLIDEFKSITGEGLVLNTSFNLAGEPLVETPKDALRSFACGGLDALYLNGWLIEK